MRSDQVGTTTRRSRCLVAAAGATVALLGTSAGLVLSTATAMAAGNASLDKLIIADPESGWSNLSSTETSSLASSIQTELQSKASAGQSFSTAVEGWQSPSGGNVGLLVIFLVQATTGSVSSSASSIASNFCNGATNTTPASTPQIPNIASSAIATCTGGGVNATIGTAIKGSILTMVASTGSQVLGVSSIEPIVSSQLNALPGSSTGSSSSSSSSSTAAIIGGVVGVVVVAGIIAGVILMRRRQSGVAVAGAGAPGFGGAPPVGGSSFYPPHQAAPAPPAAPVQPAQSYVAPAASGASDDPWGGGAADPGWVTPLDAPPAATAHPDAAQGSAPGWYPEGGDNSVMRYWDGSKFTGRRRWDGASWVEA